MSRARHELLLGSAALFAALAVLVSAGRCTRLDEWAVHHLMPGASFGGGPPTLLGSLVPLLHDSWSSALAAAANVVTLPASPLISLALVGACCEILRRRGRPRAALAWALAWAAGAAVELLCKSVIVRPRLHAGAVPLPAFDSSWPSGHTLRTLLVASVFACVRPGARVAAGAWAVASIVLLQLAGWHTPSDIAGGIALAALLVTAARRSR